MEAELAEVKRRAARLVDQVADGFLSGAAVKEKLATLEATRLDLEARLAVAPPANVVALHPAAPQRFRDLIERLNVVLVEGDSAELAMARSEFRRLIRSVEITPPSERGAFHVTVE